MSFDTLYHDMKKIIISYCDLQTMGILSQVSKEVNRIISNEKEDFREKYIEKMKAELYDTTDMCLFWHCCISGKNTTVIRYLLKVKGVDPGKKRNYAIRVSSEYGNLEIVKILLSDSRVDPGAEYNYAIENS